MSPIVSLVLFLAVMLVYVAQLKLALEFYSVTSLVLFVVGVFLG